MIKKLTYSITLISLLPFFSQAQSVGTTEPLGASLVRIDGNGGSGDKITFLAFPYSNQPVYQNAMTGIGSSTITVAGAGWTTDEFADTHFVEIQEGTGEGYTATIIANTATVLTLAEDLSGMASGTEVIKIRPYVTIADIFGANNEVGLQGGSSTGGNTDLLYVPKENVSQNGYDIYFYKDSGIIGGTGWRLGTDLVTDKSDTVIYPNSGFAVSRKSPTDVTFCLTGFVQTIKSVSPIENGINFLASNYPLNATLNTLFGDESSGIVGGSSTGGNTDEVLVPDGSGGYLTYFYKNSGIIGGTGWRLATDLITDQGNTVISKPGETIIFKRKTGAFNFTELVPF